MSSWNRHYPVEEIGEQNGHYMVKTYRLKEPISGQISSWEDLQSRAPDESDVNFATNIMSTGSTDPLECYKCRDCGLESVSPPIQGVDCE